jgi:hypothetical protein
MYPLWLLLYIRQEAPPADARRGKGVFNTPDRRRGPAALDKINASLR